MLIYEKDNKLNINFENNVDESPDLQISKSGDGTEVLIDGQPVGGSSSGANVLTLYVEIIEDDENNGVLTGKAYKNEERTIEFSGYQEAVEAVKSADIIKVLLFGEHGYDMPIWATLSDAQYINDQMYSVTVTVIAPQVTVNVILVSVTNGNQ